MLVLDVKGDDTDGVKMNDSQPNILEMQTALGNKVRELLIEKVGKRVGELPAKIFEDARASVQQQNLDDAGEAYMRYLRVTQAEKTPERVEAEKFLQDQFNFVTFPSAAQ